MRTLWTLLKMIVGLAIAIPLGLFAVAAVLGIVGTFMALLFVAVKLACIAFVGYGAYRLIRHFVAPSPKPAAPVVRELPSIDPYYTAALRELDAELGTGGSSSRT